MSVLQGVGVFTQIGMKYAHEVEIGDKLFNHEGVIDEVIGLSKRRMSKDSCLARHQETFVVIDGEYEPLVVTGDTDVLVNKDNNVEFVSASDLKAGDLIVSPRIKSKEDCQSPVTNDVAWFFGVYCAKGGIIIKDGKPCILIRLSAHCTQDQVRQVCKISGEFGADNVSANFDQTYQMYRIEIQGEKTIETLRALFHNAGENTPSHLPCGFHDWNLERKQHLLVGVLASFPERNEENKQSWICHSPTLSYQLCFIASSLGVSIEHKPEMWDYSGVLDVNKEALRDDNYLYKRVISVSLQPVFAERYCYDFELESGTFVSGTVVVKGVL